MKKKIIVTGLILSMLASFGSMCLASADIPESIPYSTGRSYDSNGDSDNTGGLCRDPRFWAGVASGCVANLSAVGYAIEHVDDLRSMSDNPSCDAVLDFSLGYVTECFPFLCSTCLVGVAVSAYYPSRDSDDCFTSNESSDGTADSSGCGFSCTLL